MPRNNPQRRRMRKLRNREATFKVPSLGDRLRLLLTGIGVKQVRPTKVKVQTITLGKKVPKKERRNGSKR